MTCTFRPYRPADLEACLALFDSNCPRFFHPQERADHEGFLQEPADRGEYFVLERAGEVVACGGLYVRDNGTAGLTWGMVRGDLHGQGLGGELTRFRLDQLRRRPDVRQVQIETSQYSEGYYARHGFLTVDRTADGFAPGMDEVRMVLAL